MLDTCRELEYINLIIQQNNIITYKDMIYTHTYGVITDTHFVPDQLNSQTAHLQRSFDITHSGDATCQTLETFCRYLTPPETSTYSCAINHNQLM